MAVAVNLDYKQACGFSARNEYRNLARAIFIGRADFSAKIAA
jgi:hypothetical protein